MEESVHDVLERMESVVPEYSYSSVKDMMRTDAGVRAFLISEVKKIKDLLFHVVQVSYELQKDKLSEIAEDSWDDMDSIVDRLENSKVVKLSKSKEACEECMKRVESQIGELVRRDRELVLEVKDMRRTVYLLYRQLLDHGRERHFIKNLGKIKKYMGEVNSLIDMRESILAG